MVAPVSFPCGEISSPVNGWESPVAASQEMVMLGVTQAPSNLVWVQTPPLGAP